MTTMGDFTDVNCRVADVMELNVYNRYPKNIHMMLNVAMCLRHARYHIESMFGGVFILSM